MRTFTSPNKACCACARISNERDELVDSVRQAISALHNRKEKLAARVLRQALDTKAAADIRRGESAR